MKRARTGKRIALTPRDIEIFRALARYRYLRSTYLHAFVGGASDTRFKERLGDLFHEGFLDRPGQQWLFADARYLPAVYELGEGAKRALQEQGVGEEDAQTFLSPTAHRQFAHSLMICEVLASIELGVRERSDLRFIPWPEILAKAPVSTRQRDKPYQITALVPHTLKTVAIVPDALFGIEYRCGDRRLYRFFALEVDRGTMPIVRSKSRQTSYLGKLAAYREAIAHQMYKTQLGLPNLLVLTVTTSEQRKSEIMRQLENQTGGSAVFLFGAVCGTAAPAPQLFSEPWKRVGYPSLCVADP